MIIRHLLMVTVLCSLAGCWMGDYSPPIETTTVKRTNAGLCFKVSDPGDYRLATLRIRPRGVVKDFFRMMPALSITDEQLCIPDSYYPFPKKGDFVVDYSLRSPSKMDKRRFMVAVFRLVDGEPYPLKPRNDEVPESDRERTP
ncbi:putative T6SS immunity periplasmic lipoprotein [Enterobacteriaceae bacterium LUAb1]